MSIATHAFVDQLLLSRELTPLPSPVDDFFKIKPFCFGEVKGKEKEGLHYSKTDFEDGQELIDDETPLLSEDELRAYQNMCETEFQQTKEMKTQFYWVALGAVICGAGGIIVAKETLYQNMVMKIVRSPKVQTFFDGLMKKSPGKWQAKIKKLATFFKSTLFWQFLAVLQVLCLCVAMAASAKLIYDVWTELGSVSSLAQRVFRAKIQNKVHKLALLLMDFKKGDEETCKNNEEQILSLCQLLSTIVDEELMNTEKLKMYQEARIAKAKKTSATIRNWCIFGAAVSVFGLAFFCPPAATLAGVAIYKIAIGTAIGFTITGLGQEYIVSEVAEYQKKRLAEHEVALEEWKAFLGDIKREARMKDERTIELINSAKTTVNNCLNFAKRWELQQATATGLFLAMTKRNSNNSSHEQM